MRKVIGALLAAGALTGALFLWRSFHLPSPAKRLQERHAALSEHARRSKAVVISTKGGEWTWAAQEAIREVGTNALPSLLTLITQRQDSARTAWALACVGFDALGSNAAPAMPALMSCLDNTSPAVRSVSATCLASVGLPASNAVPKLVLALTDTDAEVRRSAVSALSKLPGDPQLVVPALVAYLDGPHLDTNWTVREQGAALWALGPYASNSPAALAALRRMTKSSNWDLAQVARILLRQAEHP